MIAAADTAAMLRKLYFGLATPSRFATSKPARAALANRAVAELV